MFPKCAVCSQNERKYKCKTCSVPYCSVACYRAHQEQKCEPPAPSVTDPESGFREDSTPVPQKTVHFPTVDTVPQEKLELLGQSEHLKNLLCNRHLRQLLKEVDSGRNGMNAIRVAMMEPLFVEFADECLRLVEPSSDEGESEPSMDELVFTNLKHRR
ncbi:zinc finger HIT domain-containing protein 3 [Anopheles cruzii]|uniref:zinc finger HIT domain-containing protein 3 n=1 Tax=Anopheles cruzii TaxID=68878 RepID=UPI0022EC5F96|nr:zinc finger HIT domain-containing protein 3 [Anopheles cruzii]